MLHTLEDFCAYLYHNKDKRHFYRCYYQLVRFSRDGYRRNCYTLRRLPKKSGGTRLICEPSLPLKRIQRGILPLLSGGESAYAVAYTEGKSIRDNALPHLGQPLVVKLDIRDFFGSIRFSQVFRAIDRALESSPLVGHHYLNADDRACVENKNHNSILSFYFARFCTLDGALPQGAPTSPLLSNLVLAPVDEIIGEYCEKRRIAYTRYSDDMTFSGAFNPLSLIDFVRHILSTNGFELNSRKTKILGRGFRRKITGVVVNEKLQAAREYRRKIRQEMHYIQKYGLEDHLGHKGAKMASGEYRNQLLGRIGFVLQLSPENLEFRQYKKWILENIGESLSSESGPEGYGG
jgi:Retron-type reverse transcriptase